MTNYAFKAFEFVFYKNSTGFFHHFMTSFTINKGMFAFQFKGSLIVVEIIDLPLFVSMAARTIGNTLAIKLLVVIILMTGGAGCIHIPEFSLPAGLIRYVAGTATLPAVSTYQLE